MSEDPLNNEVSISGELTDNGIKLNAKSRAVSGFDRFLGNISDLVNAPMERRNSRIRATTAGEEKLIEAAVQHGLRRMGDSEEFAERALLTHFEGVMRKQANKDGVVREAMADLRQQPPSEPEAASGPETLDEPFLARMETLAEGASTDELRQRWGRVLAAEIRSPGTFSAKVLRTVDEMSKETALLFEEVCRYRIDRNLPIFSLRQLSYQELTDLTTAGLMLESGLFPPTFTLGHLTDTPSTAVISLGRYVLSIDLAEKPNEARLISDRHVSSENGRLKVGVYFLTEAGFAISTILPNSDLEALRSFGIKMSEVVGLNKVSLYVENPYGPGHISVQLFS